MACRTILKKKTCLVSWSICRGDPAVALHLRNTEDYRLSTFRPHGTTLGHSCFLWKIKSDFLAGLTVLKKETCLVSWSTNGVDPVVSLHLRNTANYRLPNFRPHGTKLGHSWYQWIIKSDLSGWFDNSKNAADNRLPTCGPHGTKLGHSWYQWIIKSDLLAGLTILNKVCCLGILSGWGVDAVVALHLRNVEDYGLPTFWPHGTKLGHSWY